MKRSLLVLLLLFLHTSYSALAQCSITAPTIACVGEVVEFKAVSSQSIDSVLWDLGDQSTAKQKTLNHIYSKPGSLTVKLRVYQSNGDSCDATRNITVYEGPDLKVTLDPTSEYCLSTNRICLLDSSKKGSSNGRITKRTVLWGDGNRSLHTNPSYPNSICHNYSKKGTFNITVQTENEHGCTSEESFTITIKEDFPIGFTNIYQGETCFNETHLFDNDSNAVNQNIDSFVWSWGDGTYERSKFDSNYHVYDAKGTYVVGLKVYSKNGCVNEVTKNVLIDFHEIKFVTSISDDTVCTKSTIVLQASKDYGQEWIWNVFGLSNGSNFQLDGRITYFTPPRPGLYQVSLQIKHGDCQKTETLDTVHVVGIDPQFKLLNGSQCGNNDTVYACNNSEVYGTSNYTYLWDFGDTIAPQCTTNMASGSKLDSNCNFVNGTHAKHFYHDTICSLVKLIAIDHENGCIDSIEEAVTLLLTGKDQFGFVADRFCIGNDPLNTIRFLRQECLRGIYINYDSACGKDRFIPFIDYYNYNSTCDTSGKVTVGFAIHNGDGKIYNSCDTTDFIVSDRNTCIDTLWFHDWFALQKSPRPAFYLDTGTRCLPIDIRFKLYEPDQKNIASMKWNWGDGQKVEFFPTKNYDTLPDFFHFYSKENHYELKLEMISDSGCRKEYIKDMQLGYFNDFYLPNDTCINDSFQIYDTLRYWENSTPFWRDTSYDVVGLSWDFGDGQGFSAKGPLQSYAYSQPGVYTIKMASFDEYGCVDTAEHDITITCVEAGIKRVQDKLLCGGIVRFLDSSSTKLNLGRITSHYWDFGDGSISSDLENPYHYYKKFGSFTVTHIVGTDNECYDTAYYQMEVEGPTALFDFVSDSIGCEPLTVEFDNQSINASRYIWQFGDSANLKWTTFSDTNVTNKYTEAGIYYVRLIALDSVWDDNNNEYIYCESVYPDSSIHPGIVKKVEVLPIRDVDFDVPDVICKNQPFLLINKADTIYSQYFWSISNGDNISTVSDSVQHRLSDTGWHTITYTPNYQVSPPYTACLDSISKQVYVSGVESFFEYEQKANCPEFTFENRSEFADSIRWNFGDPESDDNESTAEKVVHDFKTNDTEFNVCLMAWNKAGCRDTFCDVLASQSVFNLFIPNVFTPDGDNYNNEFDIEIEGELVYELLIYNRWGDLIFRGDKDSEFGEGLNWNGIDQKTGKKFPEGVYFYIFKYELDCGGESGESQGTITLIR